jgi:hypothetical protein
MNNFKMSPHFSYYELTTTNHRLYLEQNRTDDINLIATGCAVASCLLEPIRCHYNKPIAVHSGYRCPELNTAIGGSKSSQHVLFQAVDFCIIDVPVENTFNWIWKESGLKWGQLIGEGIVADQMTWIHLSLGYPWREKNNQQVMIWCKEKGYQYI